MGWDRHSLANRFPTIYEMFFAFWFNASNIRAELEVVKSA